MTIKKTGELNYFELRRLIKEHNKLMSINIPPKTNREGLINLIEKNGYTVDHKNQKLIPRVKMKRKQVVKLPPPQPKKEISEKAKKKREAKKQLAIEAQKLKKMISKK